MSVEQLGVNVLSNPKDREKLLGVIEECSNSMTRIQAEKEFMKEQIGEICKQLELPKRLVSKMVKVYHKRNYDEEVAVQEQFETLYQTVIG
jgi:hypothetical protein